MHISSHGMADFLSTKNSLWSLFVPVISMATFFVPSFKHFIVVVFEHKSKMCLRIIFWWEFHKAYNLSSHFD